MYIEDIADQIAWVLFIYYANNRNLRGYKYNEEVQSFISRNVISYFNQHSEPNDEVIMMGYFPLILWEQNPNNKVNPIPWDDWNVITKCIIDDDSDLEQIFSLRTASQVDIIFTKSFAINMIDLYYY